MSLYEEDPLKVSHQLAKFDGHKNCGSGDIMILICHMILPDHTTKVQYL